MSTLVFVQQINRVETEKIDGVKLGFLKTCDGEKSELSAVDGVETLGGKGVHVAYLRLGEKFLRIEEGQSATCSIEGNSGRLYHGHVSSGNKEIS